MICKKFGHSFQFPQINIIKFRKPIKSNSFRNNPSKCSKEKLLLIEQTFEEANQRFARVRIVLPNPNNF
jgi:hypothetical protein